MLTSSKEETNSFILASSLKLYVNALTEFKSSLIILIISSNSFVGNYLMQKLEHPYKPIPLTSIKENDAIVVLSGNIYIILFTLIY